jgi:PKD repeat protein
VERLVRISIILLAVAALIGGSTASFAKDITFTGDKGHVVEGVRCGAHTPTPEETAQVAREVEAWKRAGGAVRADKSDVIIPIAFHVVAMDDGTCDVPDGQIYDQLDVLNAAYQGTGFQFVIASIDRTYNSRWSTARYGSRQATSMKEALAIDPATTFNIWLANIGGGLLGYATFPYMYPEDSYMHGVVALYSTVPGGTAYPYNEGDTITHEAGHFLGLYHTFQDGCTEPNDYCDDTPQEATPAYGCPEGRDTCSAAGIDPIKNFMDYVDDYCMDEFTSDQAYRMNEQMALYRPTMYGGTVVAGPTASFSGSPTSGDYPLTVQFTDGSSGDPTSWSWNFGDGGSSTAQNPSHTYTAAGTYTVSLTVANADGSDTMTRTGYITATEPGTGGGGTMHVADVVAFRIQSGRKYYGACTVTIEDDGGAPVANATVTIYMTGPMTGTGTAVTGADGSVTLQTGTKTDDPTDFCFEVTNVTHADYEYDSGANLVTKSCESGDVFRGGAVAAAGLTGIEPNPFNPMTVIKFNVAREGHVTLDVYDLSGRLVETLYDGLSGVGERSITWDARSHASGVYFARLRIGDEVQTQKLTLLK